MTDTIWAESEVIGLRESRSNPAVGLVRVRSRGINQHGETVLEFVRTFMAYRRHAPEAQDMFPAPVSDWTVQWESL